MSQKRTKSGTPWEDLEFRTALKGVFQGLVRITQRIFENLGLDTQTLTGLSITFLLNVSQLRYQFRKKHLRDKIFESYISK